MDREMRVVEKHLAHWRGRGLVSLDQEAQLRTASKDLVAQGTSHLVRGALAGLGGGLVLAGLVLVIAENWEALHRFTKLGGWAMLQSAFLWLAYDLGRRFPDRPALAEAFSAVAGGFLFAGIALVSQIYQLDSRPPNGLWLWLALLLPMVFVLERRAPGIVVLTALVSALGFETQQTGSWVYASNSDGPLLWLGLPMFAVALVAALPRRLPALAGLLSAWVFTISNFFLLTFGASQGFDNSSLGRAFVVALPGLAWGIARPGHLLSASLKSSEWRAFFCLSLLPCLLMGAQYDEGRVLDTAAIAVAWVAQMAIAILVVRAGARSQAGGWINAGYLAIAIGILTRYFDFFGDYLEGGLALTATGALVLFVLFTIERARRRTIGFAPAERVAGEP